MPLTVTKLISDRLLSIYVWTTCRLFIIPLTSSPVTFGRFSGQQRLEIAARPKSASGLILALSRESAAAPTPLAGRNSPHQGRPASTQRLVSRDARSLRDPPWSAKEQCCHSSSSPEGHCGEHRERDSTPNGRVATKNPLNVGWPEPIQFCPDFHGGAGTDPLVQLERDPELLTRRRHVTARA